MDSDFEASSDESSKSSITENTFKCTYENCTATFSKKSKLVYHLRRHTGERPFICNEPNCNKAYFYSYHLQRHKVKHHKLVEDTVKRIPCTFEGCSSELADRYGLKKHINRMHNPERKYPFPCNECDEGFNKKQQLVEHSYIHTKVCPFKCELCADAFSSKKEYSRHKRRHKHYLCDCGETFDKWTKLLQHKAECETLNASSDSSDESVTSEKTYKCTYENCAAKFSKNSKLVYHLRRHTGERPFACDVPNCPKAYFYSYHLLRHKEKHHKKVDSTERIPCPVQGCDLKLSDKYSLKKHMRRMHCDEREYAFTCDECNQGFHKKRQLLQHSYVHTGVLPFKCEVCENGFLTMAQCNRHKRTHKSYSCKCGQVFERWTKLLEHKRSCDVVKPKCNICDKTFVQRGNLKKHLQVHLNETDTFSCTYEGCSRSYLYKRNLIFHINKYHKHIPSPKIKCNHCEKIFTKRQNLILHTAKVHSNNENSNIKKVRKPRKDKGLKRNVAATLAGLKLPNLRKLQNKESSLVDLKERVKNICDTDDENSDNCVKAIC